MYKGTKSAREAGASLDLNQLPSPITILTFRGHSATTKQSRSLRSPLPTHPNLVGDLYGLVCPYNQIEDEPIGGRPLMRVARRGYLGLGWDVLDEANGSLNLP